MLDAILFFVAGLVLVFGTIGMLNCLHLLIEMWKGNEFTVYDDKSRNLVTAMLPGTALWAGTIGVIVRSMS